MKKFTENWKNLSVFFRVFLLMALLFFAVGLGTVGSVQSTGKSFVLQSKQANDAEEPFVIFELQLPEDIESKSKLTVREVYLNVGAIYSETAVAELRLGRTASVSANTTSASFSTVRADDGSSSGSLNLKLLNRFASEQKDEKVTAVEGVEFNWFKAPFIFKEGDSHALSRYSYYCLTAKNCNILINEIVFVGEELDKDNNGTGKLRAIEATVNEFSQLPYDTAAGETKEDALKKAAAMVDSPRIPTLSQSSFFRYTEDELYSLMTVAEMRQGNSYLSSSVYRGDKVYNSLGADLLTFGTLIFGLSPFGLRFFSMLASFGVLVFGFLFVRKLLRSDKAGLIFAVLYALCGLSISLAHLGTPLMIGLFFLVASLQLCHKFYADGMKKVNFAGVSTLGLSGLFAALSVCVNGLYLLPVLGVIGLFVAGMFRQQTAKRYRLDKAIAEYEEVGGDEADSEAAKEKKKAAVSIAQEYRIKNEVAPLAFGAALLLGLVVLSLLFILPASFAYVKIYDNPALPQYNIFTLAWKAFAAGFVGQNGGSGFALFYTAYKGASVFGICINAVAALVGLFGLGFAIYRFVMLMKKKEFGKEERAELRTIVIPAAGLLLSFVATVVAAFSGGAYAFLLLGSIFAFALAANSTETLISDEKTAKWAKIVMWVVFGLLCACFALFAVFTFSIPLPASLMTKLFG
ncbi:MAG: hypothetical protein K2N74_02850 [Clostridiales bacterium]|nr:hypothetical protein [Clostridiales bacterium]